MTAFANYLQSQNTIQAPPPTPPQPSFWQKVGTGIKQSFGLAPGGYAPIPNPVNIVKSAVAPAAKVVGSAVRSIEATPDLVSGNFEKANETMQKPIFGQPTVQGSTPVQNLGTAAQVASFLVPATRLGAVAGGATVGALQAGGAAAEKPNATAGEVAGNIGLGAAGGAAIGAGLSYLPTWFKSLSKTPKLSEVETAQQSLGAAQDARTAAGAKAVDAYNSMVEQVSGQKSLLGANFANGASELTQANPELKLNLSSEQVDALNSLKESKSFALPGFLDTNNNPFLGMKVSPEFAKLNASRLAEMQNASQVALTPEQAQDLITQLNKKTFTPTVDGRLQIDQRVVSLTHEIKSAASETFGPQWDKIYSEYSQGINAVQKLDDIVNLDKAATASDTNKSLNAILKLGKTPEGKVILRQAIEDYKTVTGIDLGNPVSAIHQILDKELAVQDAETNLTAAQKQAAKPGFVKQLFEPRYLGRRVVGGAITCSALTK